MKFQKNNKIKFILVFLIFFQLFYIANKRLTFKTEIFKNSFLKDFGSEYVMTNDILELKKITNDLKLEKFNISKKFILVFLIFFQQKVLRRKKVKWWHFFTYLYHIVKWRFIN